MTVANEPTVPSRCPWCSSELPDRDARACPTCGAALDAEAPGMEIPGVTAVDPVLRAYEARAATGKRPKRGGLLGWIVGQGQQQVTIAAATEALPPLTPEIIQAIQPPSPDVRQAMLEIELEAAAKAMQGAAGPAEPEAPGPADPAAEAAEDFERTVGAAEPMAEAEPPAAEPAAAEPPASDPS